MSIMHYLGDTIDGFDEHRAKFDYTGKIWCRIYLSLTNSYPILEGDVDRLKVGPHGAMSDGACLFVANHASFLDIAVLCTVLDPVFKFIAKDSLRKFPGVGTQLVGVSCFIAASVDANVPLIAYRFVTSCLFNALFSFCHILYTSKIYRVNMSSSIGLTNDLSYAHSNRQSIT